MGPAFEGPEGEGVAERDAAVGPVGGDEGKRRRHAAESEKGGVEVECPGEGGRQRRAGSERHRRSAFLVHEGIDVSTCRPGEIRAEREAENGQEQAQERCGMDERGGGPHLMRRVGVEDGRGGEARVAHGDLGLNGLMIWKTESVGPTSRTGSDVDALQAVADEVTNLIARHAAPPPDAEAKTQVGYLKGPRLLLPNWLLETRGKNLNDPLQQALGFPLVIGELIKLMRLTKLVPQELADTLRQIAKS